MGISYASVGLVGCGLDAYWPQFAGLRDTLLDYQDVIRKHMERPGLNVIDAGLVDDVPKSRNIAASLKEAGIGLLVIYVATYSLSSTLMPLVKGIGAPVLLLNVQPSENIDYEYLNSLPDKAEMTGLWLSYCQACSIPEFSCVLNRAGVPYRIVTGHLSDERVWKELDEWICASYAVTSLRHSNFGLLGHYYCGMMDVYTDLRAVSSVFGTHVEIIEMCELKALRDAVAEDEVRTKIEEFSEAFDVSPACTSHDLEKAAMTSVAMDRMVSGHSLDALAYYYEGHEGNEYEDIVASMIAGCTLLTGRGMPTAGECEVKNAHAMKIMSLLGAGGSFSEFYAMDFKDDVVLLGHDGPAHFNMAEGRVGLVPLPVFHGKPGKGLSIQMTVKYGPVTLLSVCEGKDGIFFLAAEGESVPGPTLQIGNTNSRYRFSCHAGEFVERWSLNGPSHHCAIGVGHIASELEKVAFLLGIPFVKIS